VNWPVKRLLQHGDLGAHGAPGQLCQHFRIALPGDQGGQHVAAGDPEDVGDDGAELDGSVLEQLLRPLLLRGAGRYQVGPVAGQVPQPADLWRWHEAGPQHLPLGDLAQPDRIQLVGLGPPRQVLDVLGVHQPGLEPGRLQQIEHRLPVVAGGLHHHPCHAQASQVIAHAQQRAGHRRIRPHLLQSPAQMVLIGNPHAAHQLGLADIQRRDPLDDLFVVLRPEKHRGLLPSPGGRCPQEPGAQLEKSNPRARSDTERPVKRLPAPGLETTSAIKQRTASAGSSHPHFPPGTGIPTRDIRGLGESLGTWCNLLVTRSAAVWAVRESP
jgi:hypothetical protein